MKRILSTVLVTALVMCISNAIAVPVPGVLYESGSGYGCHFSETSTSVTKAANYSSLDQTTCASFKVYYVNAIDGGTVTLAECDTCASGYYKNGYAVSTTDQGKGGTKGGTVVTSGTDYKVYNHSGCGNIAYVAKCSARTTCEKQEIPLSTTSIPYCKSESMLIFGNAGWHTCTECESGSIANKGNTKTVPSPTPCTNQYSTYISANTCLEPCTESNCSSKTTDWTCGGTTDANACWRTRYYCYDSVHCSHTDESKCLAGYYYVSGSACAKCPADADGNPGQSAEASTSINDCYVTGGNDDSGTYSYVDGAASYECHYGK